MCDLRTEIKQNQKCCYCVAVTATCFIVSIVLLIAGFILPPMGVIDGSVLTAVGELLIFPVIVYGFRAIELGLEVKFVKGDASVTITKDEDEEEEEHRRRHRI